MSLKALGHRQKSMLRNAQLAALRGERFPVHTKQPAQRCARALFARGWLTLEEVDGVIVSVAPVARPRELLTTEREILDQIELVGERPVQPHEAELIGRLVTMGKIELVARAVDDT